jgi:hypothetical protein
VRLDRDSASADAAPVGSHGLQRTCVGHRSLAFSRRRLGRSVTPAAPQGFALFHNWRGTKNAGGAVGHQGRPDRQDRVMATMPRKTIVMPTMRPNVSDSPSKTDAVTVENTSVRPIAIG